ncbi:MAG TPA: peptide chain release factor N(5)-glutamine methyltransferase [Desulfotomaculum sp.]|nr:peptide chain release factor N(5)-glutamine methyltransferase [Desulfotomaculum sp.]
MFTVNKALLWAKNYLKKCGLENTALEAEVLLAFCIKLDRVALYRQNERFLSPEEEENFRRMIKRRGQREPVAYLTGHKEFMSLDFLVNPAVLIPRPETELLVEKALEIINAKVFKVGQTQKDKILIVDVGTGSGAIAVSIAKHIKNLSGVYIYATEISPAALDVARLNAKRHGVAGNITFWPGDLLEPLKNQGCEGQISLITANLPYIPTLEIDRLEPDVRLYEPRLALDGGKDGLDFYRRLISQGGEFLRPDGYLLMEIDPAVINQISWLLIAAGWKFNVFFDLAGKERLIAAVQEV